MTPKIYVIGSVNIDHIYHCPRLPTSGFCVVAPSYMREIGGKGLNQAYALFQAGAHDVHFGGFIGDDGVWIRDQLDSMGFPTKGIHLRKNTATGNCVIFHRESDEEENAFMLHLGANGTFDLEAYESLLIDAKPGDYLVAQNESSHVSELIQLAKKKAMTVVFNPAPIPPAVDSPTWQKEYPADILILNRLEATTMAGNFSSGQPYQGNVDDLLRFLVENTCAKMIVMTDGDSGAHLIYRGSVVYCSSFKCKVADTTGAGDTFLGYFIAHLVKDGYEKVKLEEALRLANAAAAVSISRHGTLTSIPPDSEVQTFINALELCSENHFL